MTGLSFWDRYVGYALTTKWPGVKDSKLEIIGFDMGGTSTDVSRYAGSYEHVFESTTAGMPELSHIKSLFFYYPPTGEIMLSPKSLAM